jgi:hypothetical protein
VILIESGEPVKSRMCDRRHGYRSKREHLQREAQFHTERAAVYRAYARRRDAGEFGNTPQVQAMRITVEGGIRIYEALAEWARWAATYQLPDHNHDDETDHKT